MDPTMAVARDDDHVHDRRRLIYIRLYAKPLWNNLQLIITLYRGT